MNLYKGKDVDMKKIVLFSLAVCFGLVNVASAERTRTCGPTTIGFDGNQKYDDDEFLYENETEFLLAKSGYETTGHQTSGDGHAWECDTTNPGSCAKGEKTKLMPVGHYWKGSSVDTAKVYQCGKGRGDAWIPLEEEVKQCMTKWGNLPVGKAFSKKSTIDCSGMEYTEAKELGVEWEVVCRAENYVVCKPSKCIDNYEVNIKTGKCDKVCPDCDKEDDDVKPQPDPKPNSCDHYKKYPERYACCKAGKATYWEPKNDLVNGKCVCHDGAKEWKDGKCVAKGGQQTCETLYAGNQNRINCCNAENSGDARWNEISQQCECQKDEQEWDVKTGKCMNRSNGVVDGDDKTECEYYSNIAIKCKNGKEFEANHTFVLSRDKVSRAECDVLKSNFVQLQNLVTTTQSEVSMYKELIETICGDGSTSIAPAVDQKKIDAAKSKLKQFFAEAEDNASVWKTEEGKFNTARLASDLTAGVVLGTVGGVVSGHIIKKKQIEKGFEVLHCTVGGQTIADWGDEFSVGLKR